MKKKNQESNLNMILIAAIGIMFIFAVGAHIVNSVDKEKMICGSVNGTVKLSSQFDAFEKTKCILKDGTIINISDIKLVGLD